MYLETEKGAPRKRLSRETLAVHGGRGDAAAGAPLNAPPVFASAFRAGGAHGYAREESPTWEALEQAVGAIERGVAVAFSSGMAAIAGVLEGLAPGARVVVASSTYLEARKLLEIRQAQGGLRLTTVDPRDTEQAIEALPGADMLWLDAISNPTLDVPELGRLAAAARGEGVKVVVDATLATPILLRPLELGAEVVVHSATKHIGGHSDLVLGLAVARSEHEAARFRDTRTALGSVPGTMEAWLALRGLRTLPLRIEREQASAGLLAERLAAHPGVDAVRYPGLTSDPSHDVAARLLDGFGTVVSFVLEGGAERADALCSRLRVFTHATSLGGVESLIDRHSRCQEGTDAPAGLLRISVGCEHPDDLWWDLESALDRSSRWSSRAA